MGCDLMPVGLVSRHWLPVMAQSTTPFSNCWNKLQQKIYGYVRAATPFDKVTQCCGVNADFSLPFRSAMLLTRHCHPQGLAGERIEHHQLGVEISAEGFFQLRGN